LASPQAHQPLKELYILLEMVSSLGIVWIRIIRSQYLTAKDLAYAMPCGHIKASTANTEA